MLLIYNDACWAGATVGVSWVYSIYDERFDLLYPKHGGLLYTNYVNRVLNVNRRALFL